MSNQNTPTWRRLGAPNAVAGIDQHHVEAVPSVRPLPAAAAAALDVAAAQAAARSDLYRASAQISQVPALAGAFGPNRCTDRGVKN